MEEMYRQIWVHPQDKGYQLIVWRRNPLEKIGSLGWDTELDKEDTTHWQAFQNDSQVLG